MDNRLTPEEQKALEKLKQYFRHRTPENHKHMVNAAKELVRAYG